MDEEIQASGLGPYHQGDTANNEGVFHVFYSWHTVYKVYCKVSMPDMVGTPTDCH